MGFHRILSDRTFPDPAGQLRLDSRSSIKKRSEGVPYTNTLNSSWWWKNDESYSSSVRQFPLYPSCHLDRCSSRAGGEGGAYQQSNSVVCVVPSCTQLPGIQVKSSSGATRPRGDHPDPKTVPYERVLHILQNEVVKIGKSCSIGYFTTHL